MSLWPSLLKKLRWIWFEKYRNELRLQNAEITCLQAQCRGESRSLLQSLTCSLLLWFMLRKSKTYCRTWALAFQNEERLEGRGQLRELHRDCSFAIGGSEVERCGIFAVLGEWIAIPRQKLLDTLGAASRGSPVKGRISVLIRKIGISLSKKQQVDNIRMTFDGSPMQR
jgi:hypothetical protein